MDDHLYLISRILQRLKNSIRSRAKTGGGDGIWGESALSFMATDSVENTTVSLGNSELIPSDKRGSRGKEAAISWRSLPLTMHQQFRGLLSPSSSGSSYMSPFLLTACHSFPVNALTLTINILQNWEFNLCCNSARSRMKF